MEEQLPSDDIATQPNSIPSLEIDNEPKPDYFQHVPPAPQQMPPQQYQDPIKDIFVMVKGILWGTGFISFLLMLIFSFVIVLAMTPEIQNWIITPDSSTGQLQREIAYILSPIPVEGNFLIGLFYVDGIGFQAWHIGALLAIIGAFSYANYELFKDWVSRKKDFMLSFILPEKANSTLEGVAKLFMASSFFSTLYFLILALSDTEMNTPAFDEFSRPELIYGLFNASIFEEFVSRVLLIGVPLLIYALIKKWKNPLKKLLGGGLDITPLTMILITLSAILFALAHVGGWDFWKVPQVLVSGFALGYAFVRYGIHASILIHFSINLSSSALEIWPDNLVIGSILGAAFFIWIIIGCYFFFDYIWRLLVKLSTIQQPKPAIQKPPPIAGYQPLPPNQQNYEGQPDNLSPPPPKPNYPPSPKGFVCPTCGHTGASYTEGQLICMRCHTRFGDEPVIQKTDDKQIYDF